MKGLHHSSRSQPSGTASPPAGGTDADVESTKVGNEVSFAATTGAFGRADADVAIHAWTLYPYHASFAATERGDETMRRMRGTGQWLHEALGCGFTAPEALRFCRRCRSEMLERHGDAWWRRTHQLPSTLVCPEHGETLLSSRLARERRRGAYVAPRTPNVPTTDRWSR